MTKWRTTWLPIEQIPEPQRFGSIVIVENPEWGSIDIVRTAHAGNPYNTEPKPWVSHQDGKRFSWDEFTGDAWVRTVGDTPVELMERRRLSRPCYDKYYRCPGRNGGGTHYPKIHMCESGSLLDMHGKRLWRWRLNHCNECNVIVLPYMIRCVDPTNWGWWEIKNWADNLWTWKLRYPYLRARRLLRRVLRTEDR